MHQLRHCIYNSDNAPITSSSHQNTPRADTNRQCDPIGARTSPHFQNRISSLVHASETDQLLERSVKTNDRSGASRGYHLWNKLASADDNPIEVGTGSTIPGQRKSQKPSLYSVSLSVAFDYVQGARRESRTAAGRTGENNVAQEKKKVNDVHVRLFTVLRLQNEHTVQTVFA